MQGVRACHEGCGFLRDDRVVILAWRECDQGGVFIQCGHNRRSEEVSSSVHAKAGDILPVDRVNLLRKGQLVKVLERAEGHPFNRGV